MTRLPIYQMTYGQDAQGTNGLIFTSEQENLNNQSFLFAIPMMEPIEQPIDFIKYAKHFTFYFPFLLNERYLELEARVDFPGFIFEIPETKFQVTFEIDTDNFNYWQYFYLSRRFKRPWKRRYQKLEYVGTANKLIPTKAIGFIPIVPVDLYEMDELYLEHRGVFVGLTSNFGTESFIN